MIKINRLAEREIEKFKRNDPGEKTAAWILFMKHCCDWEPMPNQILMAEQCFKNPYILAVQPPRSGKTMGVEGVGLYEMATNEAEDLRIYVPKHKQGKDALKYHYDWIDKSKILRAFLRKKNGKPIFSSVNYEFVNMSNAEIYTIRGEIEGHNVTIMRIEEFDDWQWERFHNDVLRRGAAKNRNGLPTRIRITGTIMGQENIYKVVTERAYRERFVNLMETQQENILNLPPGIKMDVHTLQQMGILDPEFVLLQRELMGPDEWARSMLLLFTESTNFIWSSYLRQSIKKGDEWGLEPVEVEKGGIYNNYGVVSVGFDCGHAGDSEESSKYTLHVYEQVGSYRRWLNGYEWNADYDTVQLEKEILEILSYFRPSGGYADALKHNFIASMNDKAFKMGLTDKNREDNPENTTGNWESWWIAPLWNTGKNKHFYYNSLKQGIHHGECFYPYFDKKDDRRVARIFKKFQRSILSIRKEETHGTYPKYYSVDNKVGDDHTDAAGMANLWLDIHVEKPVDFNLIKTAGRQTKMSAISANSVLGDLHIDRDDIRNF